MSQILEGDQRFSSVPLEHIRETDKILRPLFAPEDDVKSTVYVSLKAEHPSDGFEQYFGSHVNSYPHPQQTEPEAYASYVEQDPGYLEDRKTQNRYPISLDLKYYTSIRNLVMLDSKPQNASHGYARFAIDVEGRPSESWTIKYGEKYFIMSEDRSHMLHSTPVYPGRFHRSFPCMIERGTLFAVPIPAEPNNAIATFPVNILPAPNSPIKLYSHCGKWAFRRASPDDGNTVIRNGDKVFLEMFDYAESFPSMKYISRGLLGRQKAIPGDTWEWQAGLGTEQYSTGLGIDPIVFTIELSSPPRPAET